MSYYDTISEDLVRAKKIIATGSISGGDAYAAFELLESFAEHVERYQRLLAIMGATDYESAVRAWRALGLKQSVAEDYYSLNEFGLPDKTP